MFTFLNIKQLEKPTKTSNILMLKKQNLIIPKYNMFSVNDSKPCSACNKNKNK